MCGIRVFGINLHILFKNLWISLIKYENSSSQRQGMKLY